MSPSDVAAWQSSPAAHLSPVRQGSPAVGLMSPSDISSFLNSPAARQSPARQGRPRGTCFARFSLYIAVILLGSPRADRGPGTYYDQEYNLGMFQKAQLFLAKLPFMRSAVYVFYVYSKHHLLITMLKLAFSPRKLTRPPTCRPTHHSFARSTAEAQDLDLGILTY